MLNRISSCKRWIIFLLCLPILHLHAELPQLSQSLLALHPGPYQLSILTEFMSYASESPSSSGVKAMIYVPESLGDIPMEERKAIHFFHGSTRDLDYYKEDVDYMIGRAEEYGFLLVSIQNWWPISGDDLAAIDDSAQAANLISWALVFGDLILPNNIFVTGFSAGGLTALSTVVMSLPEPILVNGYSMSEGQDDFDYQSHGANGMLSLEKVQEAENWLTSLPEAWPWLFPYGGFASFKGNFYPFAISPSFFVNFEDPAAYYAPLFEGRIAYLSVGGEGDTARVRAQAPEAFQTLSQSFGIPVILEEFPSDGHELSREDWERFWDLVQSE